MENRKTILAIDDNRDILYTLEQICRFQDWVPLLAAGYEEAERFIKNERIDLILVDYHMPGVDGITAVKEIRKRLPKTPIIVLTIEEKEQIVSRFMDAGADDYLAKPFIMEELLARLRALTRRKGTYLGDTLSQGNLKLNRDTGELLCSDSSVKLGNKEYQVMEMLLANPKQTIAKDRFVEKIWGYDTEAEYNSVEVYISFLRKKMSKLNSDMAIKTVRGRGYLLDKAS